GDRGAGRSAAVGDDPRRDPARLAAPAGDPGRAERGAAPTTVAGADFRLRAGVGGGAGGRGGGAAARGVGRGGEADAAAGPGARPAARRGPGDLWAALHRLAVAG